MSNLFQILKRIRGTYLGLRRHLMNKNDSPMEKTLQGRLLRSQASEFGDRVYYVDKGRRHWVRDGEWLKRNGFNWSADVEDVAPEILYGFLNAGIAPIKSGSDLGKPNL